MSKPSTISSPLIAGQILIASDRTQVDDGEKITIHAPSEVPKDLEINLLNFKRILGTSE